MAELVNAFSNLSLQNETCSSCNSDFVETYSARYCAVCSSLNHAQPLCDFCSQTVLELSTTICYFHMRSLLKDNAIVFCLDCAEIISSPCEHNYANQSVELAEKYLRLRYPSMF